MHNLFEIDPNKCKHDGICAAECPLRLITTDGKDKLPTPADRTGIECINCGHCVTVCPHGAFTLKTMKPEECAPLDRKLLPAADQIKLFLTARRSIRAYQKQPVDRATLSDLIDTARYAPTSVNTQPVNWLVIEDAGEVNRLAGLVIDWMRQAIEEQPALERIPNMKRHIAGWDKGEDGICRSAPHVIVAHAPAALASVQLSCTTTLTYLELAAFSKGLGACWAGYFNRAANLYPPMQEALRLPEGHQCFGAMLVGYPQYQYHRIPLRKKATITWR